MYSSILFDDGKIIKKEEDERETCLYCNGSKYIEKDNVTECNIDSDLKSLDVHVWEEYNDIEWDAIRTFKINYCPMCGEKL